MSSDPWKDKGRLTELYCHEKMSTEEIAEQMGCNSGTINYWLKKFDIDLRDHKEAIKEANEDDLSVANVDESTFGKVCPTCKNEYSSERGVRTHHARRHGECLPNKECELCSKSFYDRKGGNSPVKYCDSCKYGFEGGSPPIQFTHKSSRPRRNYMTEVIRHKKKDVRVHRLLMVAKNGIESVKDKHVHHKNGIPWDNRPENLEIMTPEQHTRHHKNEEHKDKPWRSKELMKEALQRNSQREAADLLGCTVGTMIKWRKKHGLKLEP